MLGDRVQEFGIVVPETHDATEKLIAERPVIIVPRQRDTLRTELPKFRTPFGSECLVMGGSGQGEAHILLKGLDILEPLLVKFAGLIGARGELTEECERFLRPKLLVETFRELRRIPVVVHQLVERLKFGVGDVAPLGGVFCRPVRLLLAHLRVLRRAEVLALGDVGFEGVLEGHIGVVAVVHDEVDLLLPRSNVLLLPTYEIRVIGVVTALLNRYVLHRVTSGDLPSGIYVNTGRWPFVVTDVDQVVLGLLECRVGFLKNLCDTLGLGRGVVELLGRLSDEALGDARVGAVPLGLVRLGLHPVSGILGEQIQFGCHVRPVVGCGLQLRDRRVDYVLVLQHSGAPPGLLQVLVELGDGYQIAADLCVVLRMGGFGVVQVVGDLRAGVEQRLHVRLPAVVDLEHGGTA